MSPLQPVSGRPADVDRFSRLISRMRNGIIRIRRAGVPHEETVIIPAIALNVASTFIGNDGWHFWVAIIPIVAVFLVCGAWLGLAWRGFPLFRVILRLVYIAALAVLLFMLTHDQPVSKQEAVRSALIIISALGPMFYIGSFFASLVRDFAVRDFSDKLRRKHSNRMAWGRHIWRLAREQEDKNTASGLDYFAATLLQNCMNPNSLLILFWLLGMLIYGPWVIGKAITSALFP